MLDQLGALGAGADQPCLEWSRHRAGNHIGLPVIAAVHHGPVGTFQHGGTTVSVGPHHNAVGIKKIGHCGALPQKLRIGGHIKQLRRGAVQQHDLADPTVGVNGDGALLDHYFITVNGGGNALGH